MKKLKYYILVAGVLMVLTGCCTVDQSAAPTNDSDYGVFAGIKHLDNWIRRNLW